MLSFHRFIVFNFILIIDNGFTITVLQSFTVFLCSLNLWRTLWSITSRTEGQHLKFIFCIFKKPSDSFSKSCSIVNGEFGWSVWGVFLFVEQFKSFDDSICVPWW